MTKKKYEYDLDKPFFGLPFNEVDKMLRGTWVHDEELTKKLNEIYRVIDEQKQQGKR
ncbi:hypothetical protein SAMN05880501_10922 [Ureibacillus xyleni]|uniref:Uncharacterized protein n=1 Tax=Ureibacillus xyleni TaxID=614648 RepID=A0A285T5A6_9BACL|nr:hypothetical protein [Ureibacillus xyleni]SOC16559.1 hypothetical protein SAMN05880501_10922 [Ureibacillus xyleni]